jgi:ATP-binding cassette subfamily B protein
LHFLVVQQTLINLGIVVVLFFSRKWVQQGSISVGQVVAFINYMTQFYFAMSIISRIFNVFVKAKTSDERITAVFDAESVEDPQTCPQEALEGTLTFKNVSFRYGEGEDALKNLSFSIKNNETIGVLGGTGSGKTTLVHLVNRLLSPSEGEIYLGGLPLNTIPRKVLTDHVSYVPQKSILFSGTILENLSFGKRALEEADYYKAIEDASADEFIDAIENGLHAKIGKDGVNISGGQKQRLAIARALVSQAKIIILDDSTSAVDVITERKIKESLKKRSMTSLVVGQKITTVMDMDRIMILDEGRLVAFDSHESLLKNNELYQAIYEAEFGGGSHESLITK